MPTAGFHRWADRFDQRHRYGIPVLPTKRRAPVPPTLVPLPARAGSMRFTDEDVSAVIDLLRQAGPGQAVRLTDEPDDNDNSARRRSELLKEQADAMLKARAVAIAAAADSPDTDDADDAAEPDPADAAGVVKIGYKIRGHVLTAGESTVETHTSEKSGKTYKITKYPQNWGAVSLVPESDPDDTPAPAAVNGNGDTANENDTSAAKPSRSRR